MNIPDSKLESLTHLVAGEKIPLYEVVQAVAKTSYDLNDLPSAVRFTLKKMRIADLRTAEEFCLLKDAFDRERRRGDVPDAFEFAHEVATSKGVGYQIEMSAYGILAHAYAVFRDEFRSADALLRFGEMVGRVAAGRTLKPLMKEKANELPTNRGQSVIEVISQRIAIMMYGECTTKPLIHLRPDPS